MNYKKDGKLVVIDTFDFDVSKDDVVQQIKDIRMKSVKIPLKVDTQTTKEKYLIYLQYGKCTIGSKPFEIVPNNDNS